MRTATTRQRSISARKKLSWGRIVPAIGILLTIVSGAFILGNYFGVNKYDIEKNSLNDQNNTLKSRLDSAMHDNKQPSGRSAVMTNGSLSPGFGMGVNSNEGRTDWVKKIGDAQVMAFPGSDSWGAMFVTAGAPAPKNRRKSFDFRSFHSLSVELKGTRGDSVDIGLKSPTDNDDGSETKLTIVLRNNDWNIYTFDLSKFESADLSHLYVITEFVFYTKPETISLRKITFNKQ